MKIRDRRNGFIERCLVFGKIAFVQDCFGKLFKTPGLIILNETIDSANAPIRHQGPLLRGMNHGKADRGEIGSFLSFFFRKILQGNFSPVTDKGETGPIDGFCLLRIFVTDDCFPESFLCIFTHHIFVCPAQRIILIALCVDIHQFAVNLFLLGRNLGKFYHLPETGFPLFGQIGGKDIAVLTCTYAFRPVPNEMDNALRIGKLQVGLENIGIHFFIKRLLHRCYAICLIDGISRSVQFVAIKFPGFLDRLGALQLDGRIPFRIKLHGLSLDILLEVTGTAVYGQIERLQVRFLAQLTFTGTRLGGRFRPGQRTGEGNANPSVGGIVRFLRHGVYPLRFPGTGKERQQEQEENMQVSSHRGRSPKT